MDVPAGWYPDPASPTTSARWWDGSTWTDHTRALDQLPAPGQPAAPAYAAPSAETVVLPVAPQSPDFVAPFVPSVPADYSQTAAYPTASAYSSATGYPADPGYDATLFPQAPEPRRSVGWGVIALIGALVVVLAAAAVLVVKNLGSGSTTPSAASPRPTASAPSSPAPSATGSTPTGTPGGSTAAEIAAGKVLETMKPTAPVLPAGLEATLITDGDVAQGQRTLDGWCSSSYASEADRIARRQWALTQGGQDVGLSIEVVAYGTPEQASAALAEFTAKSDACTDVSVVEDGQDVTMTVVSTKRMAALPAGISGYRATATMSAQDTSGSTVTVNSSATMQCKGVYCSIVWTNQSTPITAADQRAIDAFVAQQTAALARTR